MSPVTPLDLTAALKNPSPTSVHWWQLPFHQYPLQSQLSINATQTFCKHVADQEKMLRDFDTKPNQQFHLPPTDYPYNYKFNTTMLNWVNAIFHPETGKMMAYRKLIESPDTWQIWLTLFANEISQLANDVGNRIKTGTNNIHFIKHYDMPKDREKINMGKLCVGTKLTSLKNINRVLLSAATKLTIPLMCQPQQQI